MSDDLVERVARAIRDASELSTIRDFFQDCARAAIAVCMEEAAKVCDEAEKRERQAAKEPYDAEELAAFQRGAFMSRINAAAIRALKEEK